MTFVDFVTPVPADWLNNVNTVVNTGFPTVSTLNFTVPFTGGVSRSLANHWLDLLSVKDFGAKGDGVTDDTAAITAALNAVNTAVGSTLFFPSGIYILSANIAMTMNSANTVIRIMGAGRDNTVLRWTNPSGGLAITYNTPANPWAGLGNALIVEHLAFQTSVLNGGNGLVITGNYLTGIPNINTEVAHCTFEGTSQAFQWTNNLVYASVTNSNTYDVTIFGARNTITNTGISYTGSSTAEGGQHNLSMATITFAGNGVLCGNHVQGVLLSQVNLVFVANGVYAPDTSGVNSQISVYNSQIQAQQNCIFLEDMVDCQIIGNLLYPGNGIVGGTAITLLTVGRSTVVGNTITGTSMALDSGIVVTGTPYSSNYATCISNNVFDGCVTAINLTASTTNNWVNNNGYGIRLGNRLVDSGSGNVVQVSRLKTSILQSITFGAGGSASFSVAVPANYFVGAPVNASCTMETPTGGVGLVGFYNPASSTATSLSFTVANIFGGAVSGSFNFCISADQ